METDRTQEEAMPHGITSAGGHGYTLPSGSSLASSGLDSNCNLGGGSIGGDGKARAGALTHLFSVQMRLGANMIGHARNNMYVCTGKSQSCMVTSGRLIRHAPV